MPLNAFPPRKPLNPNLPTQPRAGNAGLGMKPMSPPNPLSALLQPNLMGVAAKPKKIL